MSTNSLYSLHSKTKYLLDIYIDQGDERSNFPYDLAVHMNCNNDMLYICKQYDYKYDYKRNYSYYEDNVSLENNEIDFMDDDELINIDNILEDRDTLEDNILEDNTLEDNTLEDDISNENEWITV